MSLWVCAEHGLYGGDMFCPACRRAGSYASAGEAGTAETTKIGSVHEHAVGEAETPETPHGRGR